MSIARSSLPPLKMPPRRAKFLSENSLEPSCIVQDTRTNVIVRAVPQVKTRAEAMRYLLREGLRAHHTVGFA